jgi:hypothetical protein
MLQYWPADMPVDMNVNLDDPAIHETWIAIAYDIEFETRPIPACNNKCTRGTKRPIGFDGVDIHDESTLNVSETGTKEHGEEKRFIPVIIAAIMAFLGRAAPFLVAVGTGASGLAQVTVKEGLRLAKNGAAVAKNLDDMKDAARQMAQSKNWVRCLSGLVPEGGI